MGGWLREIRFLLGSASVLLDPGRGWRRLETPSTWSLGLRDSFADLPSWEFVRVLVLRAPKSQNGLP